MMKPIDVFKVTTDNWYPSFNLENQMLVKVSFLELPLLDFNEPLWRVCVWGDDDCGMERDFESETEAWTCFLEIIGLDDVNREELFSRHFFSA